MYLTVNGVFFSKLLALPKDSKHSAQPKNRALAFYFLGELPQYLSLLSTHLPKGNSIPVVESASLLFDVLSECKRSIMITLLIKSGC